MRLNDWFCQRMYAIGWCATLYVGEGKCGSLNGDAANMKHSCLSFIRLVGILVQVN